MASRESLKMLCKQRQVVRRGLSALALGGNGEIGAMDLGRKGFRVARSVSSSAQCAQIASQLEVSIAVSDPASGFQTFGQSAVPGFAMPSGFRPVALTPIEKLDEAGLAREMSSALSHQKMEETVRLYDVWVKLSVANQPNILIYNLLLHAKLRLGAHPDVMFRIVSEMEKRGVTPTQLSYNFLLRSVFP